MLNLKRRPDNRSIAWFTKAIGWLLVALVFFTASSVSAQKLRYSGFLQLDKRFTVSGDSVGIADFYNRFRLELAAPMNNRLFAFASVDFRFYDLPRVGTLSQLEDLSRDYPTELSIWEAYVDVYGFLSKNFDLRIGKQRLAWGTADKLNPTDNLNPDDFSDLVNFAEKIPTWAITGNYYLGDFTLTGVWLPSLTPVLLPRHGADLFLGSQASEFQDTLALPAPRLNRSMFAFKIGGNLGKWDYSLSYFNGFDDIPILTGVKIKSLTNAKLYLNFPKIQVVGADFATELSGVGLWGEGALFLPKKVITRKVMGQFTSSSVALEDKPYFKFTLGGDYTFPGGWYINSQWMHGFFTERGEDSLHDYFILLLEKQLLQNRIKVSLGGGLEVADWQEAQNNYGFGLFPELTYQAIDNLELSVGSFSTGGKPSTLFGSWKNADQIYLRAKISF
ncbi:hypothetical protein BMS3Abin05_00073 [bacterium BMS3Abin05]|nr:hypothetical protein BMS3Abin05_00073 [bacterium BMS3Abin05]GBE28133.1 hypothetical protein BMS3Bbin03_02069 [bacterium BMS3Bbin03]HDK35776.1 hypothetical protein [Bacteroidota bacterium]HDZ12030.1 hypothetical protein [Bacteroidota bacterium]